MTSIPRHQHRIARFLLLAGVILMSATLTQCKMVVDDAMRPDVNLSAAGLCISGCAEKANEAMRVESERHTTNVKNCGKDSACKQLEARRHESVVKEIQAQRKACQNACHHQGGGTGR